MSYIHPAQAIIPFGQNKVSTESSKIKRVFIVGQSGHGKSTSAFKDPPGSCVYVDGENNAPPEFSTRSDILYLPFHDLAWVKKNFSAAPTYRDWETDRKSTRLNSSHRSLSRMPSSA